MEMMLATGSCAGIENYSRYLTGRRPGEPPPTLFEYIPDNALVFVDESHVTIPQIGGMYPRRLQPQEARSANTASACPPAWTTARSNSRNGTRCVPQTISVSATPGPWEMERTGGVFAEQVIRPTGLIDPPVEVRPVQAHGHSQVDDVIAEVKEKAKQNYRSLVTVLTKRMAEDLTEYMHEQGVRVRYMHSDIDTVERIEIIRDLRLGAFDVLVGINLLREGLDIPECGLVAILDADKEGFLRSETSLVQTIGRAARNIDGKVILYADRITGSMERAMAETQRRREKQHAFNLANRHHAAKHQEPDQGYSGQRVRKGFAHHRSARSDGWKRGAGGNKTQGRSRRFRRFRPVPRPQHQGRHRRSRTANARSRRRPRIRNRRAPARRDQALAGNRTADRGRSAGEASGCERGRGGEDARECGEGAECAKAEERVSWAEEEGGLSAYWELRGKLKPHTQPQFVPC